MKKSTEKGIKRVGVFLISFSSILELFWLVFGVILVLKIHLKTCLILETFLDGKVSFLASSVALVGGY